MSIELRRKTLKAVENIASNDKLTSETFLDLCQCLDQSSLMDSAEERALSKLCGYAMCSNHIPHKKIKQQYTIIGQRVLNAQELAWFCSFDCFKSICYLREQLPNEPLWLTGNRPKINLKFMDERETIVNYPSVSGEIREPIKFDDSSLVVRETDQSQSSDDEEQLIHMTENLVLSDSDADIPSYPYGPSDSLEGWCTKKEKAKELKMEKPRKVITLIEAKPMFGVVEKSHVRWEWLAECILQWTSQLDTVNQKSGRALSETDIKVRQFLAGDRSVNKSDHLSTLSFPTLDSVDAVRHRRNIFSDKVMKRISVISRNLGLVLDDRLKRNVDKLVFTADNLCMNPQETNVAASVFIFALSSPISLKKISEIQWKAQLKPFPFGVNMIYEKLNAVIDIVNEKLSKL